MSWTRRVRAVMLDLAMLSEGKVQSWNSDKTHGGDPDYSLVGDDGRSRLEETRFAYWHRQITSSQTPSEFVERITRAEEYVDRHKRGRNADVERWVRVMLAQTEGMDYKKAAEGWKISTTYLRRLRCENGRNPLDGRLREEA